ncbi:uncharacterized protein LOC136028312 isoform X1 [Artemia franciscana]|uniref:Uncharacterized protein n=1 Tax=Artemia franciscana TaxID=6661 RepID=A0AA88HIY8_ARTSF|nr:hypothetical protein QYM36_014128 [Artemia franciscana]
MILVVSQLLLIVAICASTSDVLEKHQNQGIENPEETWTKRLSPMPPRAAVIVRQFPSKKMTPKMQSRSRIDKQRKKSINRQWMPASGNRQWKKAPPMRIPSLKDLPPRKLNDRYRPNEVYTLREPVWDELPVQRYTDPYWLYRLPMPVKEPTILDKLEYLIYRLKQKVYNGQLAMTMQEPTPEILMDPYQQYTPYPLQMAAIAPSPIPSRVPLISPYPGPVGLVPMYFPSSYPANTPNEPCITAQKDDNTQHKTCKVDLEDGTKICNDATIIENPSSLDPNGKIYFSHQTIENPDGTQSTFNINVNGGSLNDGLLATMGSGNVLESPEEFMDDDNFF